MTDEKLYTDDNVYTLNALRKTLQCNRLTAEKYIAKGQYKKTTKLYNGKEFEAWIITEREIDRLRTNLQYMQYGSAMPRTLPIKDILKNDDVTQQNITPTSEMLRNITDLNSRITLLENDNRSLQKELKDLTNENTILLREKHITESKMLMIEDKSKTVEAAYAKETQEVQKLNGVIDNLNAKVTQKEKTITYLIAGIVVVVTVILTILGTVLVVKNIGA